jgi:hypothetical protein
MTIQAPAASAAPNVATQTGRRPDAADRSRTDSYPPGSGCVCQRRHDEPRVAASAGQQRHNLHTATNAGGSAFGRA